MENASDALKMAFAVFVFIIALSIVFSLITKAKETADAVLLNSDKTTYYDWVDGSTEVGRVVEIDTVISTLKNYTTQGAYVIVDGEEFNYSTEKSKIDTFILENINTGDKYKESIREITTGGEYMLGEDGTKIPIVEDKGKIRTYIVYEKD